MKRSFASSVLTVCILYVTSLGVAFAQKTTTQDPAALRIKCAHLVKVKLGIKETGSASDLQGVRGAVAMVDQCVANGGKVN